MANFHNFVSPVSSSGYLKTAPTVTLTPPTDVNKDPNSLSGILIEDNRNDDDDEGSAMFDNDDTETPKSGGNVNRGRPQMGTSDDEDFDTGSGNEILERGNNLGRGNTGRG